MSGHEEMRLDEMIFSGMHQGLQCYFCYRRLSSLQPFFKNRDKTDHGKPIYMCPECISAGIDFREHGNGDSLQLSDNLGTIPVFSKDWSACEELLMLEGLVFAFLFCFLPSSWAQSFRIPSFLDASLFMLYFCSQELSVLALETGRK